MVFQDHGKARRTLDFGELLSVVVLVLLYELADGSVQFGGSKFQSRVRHALPPWMPCKRVDLLITPTSLPLSF